MSEEQTAYLNSDGTTEVPQMDGKFPFVDRETGKKLGIATVRRQDYFGVPTFYQAWFKYDDPVGDAGVPTVDVEQAAPTDPPLPHDDLPWFVSDKAHPTSKDEYIQRLLAYNLDRHLKLEAAQATVTKLTRERDYAVAALREAFVAACRQPQGEWRMKKESVRPPSMNDLIIVADIISEALDSFAGIALRPRIVAPTVDDADVRAGQAEGGDG